MDLTAVIRLFKKQKVVTIDQLASWLSCSFLSHFRDHPAIYRENRMGRWIWFAADPGARKQQMQTRLDG